MGTYRPRSPATVSRYMSAIKSVGGRAEAGLRSALHRRGLRFRRNEVGLTGRPDIVFRSARIVVFIDGDFWHARTLREKGLSMLTDRLQTHNRDYWLRKFEGRVVRDDAVTHALSKEGWTVLRYWETDVRRDVARIADEVATFVRSGAIGGAGRRRDE